MEGKLAFDRTYLCLVLGFALSLLIFAVYVYFSNLQTINCLEQHISTHETYLNILNQSIKR